MFMKLLTSALAVVAVSAVLSAGAAALSVVLSACSANDATAERAVAQIYGSEHA
jgi:hypothetical protein